MKKILALLCLPVFFLSACGSNGPAIVPVTKGIAFAYAATYYNECYEGQAQIDQNGVMTLEFASPENLNGLTFVLNGEEATVSYKGLRHTYSLASAPEGAAVKTLYHMLCAPELAKNGPVLKHDRYCFEGVADGIAYTMYFGQTGLPLSVEAPEAGFSVIFQNVSITQ